MCTGSDVAMIGTALEAGGALGAGAANKIGSKVNRRTLRAQGKAELYAGRVAAERIREEGAKVGSLQRAGAAAGNVLVGQGTALKLQQETAALSGEDADMEMRNAMLREWGYRREAEQERYLQRVSSRTSYQQAFGAVAAGATDPQNKLAGLFG